MVSYGYPMACLHPRPPPRPLPCYQVTPKSLQHRAFPPIKTNGFTTAELPGAVQSSDSSSDSNTQLESYLANVDAVPNPERSDEKRSKERLGASGLSYSSKDGQGATTKGLLAISNSVKGSMVFNRSREQVSSISPRNESGTVLVTGSAQARTQSMSTSALRF